LANTLKKPTQMVEILAATGYDQIFYYDDILFFFCRAPAVSAVAPSCHASASLALAPSTTDQPSGKGYASSFT
jgi:hypothetical protein